ncbi:hypothetical protein R1flu_008413 [Riccia fluitans]|uniref:Uncharacterized protein n=1 Tax=Riccia fluitans TaxID=41844 RepID=A0ABD1YBU1_9MARC
MSPLTPQRKIHSIQSCQTKRDWKMISQFLLSVVKKFGYFMSPLTPQRKIHSIQSCQEGPELTSSNSTMLKAFWFTSGPLRLPSDPAGVITNFATLLHDRPALFKASAWSCAPEESKTLSVVAIPPASIGFSELEDVPYLFS